MREHVWVKSRQQNLSVMVHTPVGFKAGVPVAVLCHGFAGDKIGSNQLTKNLAIFLERLGYAVVRFDYIGSGDSDGDFAIDTSVAGWREDLDNILSWIKAQAQFSHSPLVLYGHSLGGLVALTHPAVDPRVSARIVFAPVTQAVDNFRTIILGEDRWQQSLRGETIHNFYGRALSLEAQFVVDLLRSDYNPGRNLADSEQPILFIHGTADDVVLLAGTQKVYDAYQGHKELVVTDFDHVAAGQHVELQQIIATWLAKLFVRPAV